jgi:isoleucyl-tRNA synthetase
VVLDTDVTPELEAEGLARDVVRAVQQARRDAQLNVSDRITLTLSADSQLATQLAPHEALIAGETLATSVVWDPSLERSVSIEGTSIGVSVSPNR